MGTTMQRIYQPWLQWSQPGTGWTTAVRRDGLEHLSAAAMEPAEDRLDDLGTTNRTQFAHALQWSHPGADWMTGLGKPLRNLLFLPPWSRPEIGRMVPRWTCDCWTRASRNGASPGSAG